MWWKARELELSVWPTCVIKLLQSHDKTLMNFSPRWHRRWRRKLLPLPKSKPKLWRPRGSAENCPQPFRKKEDPQIAHLPEAQDTASLEVARNWRVPPGETSLTIMPSSTPLEHWVCRAEQYVLVFIVDVKGSGMSSGCAEALWHWCGQGQHPDQERKACWQRTSWLWSLGVHKIFP